MKAARVLYKFISNIIYIKIAWKIKNKKEKALNFLDSVSRNVDSKAEKNYITKCIDGILR